MLELLYPRTAWSQEQEDRAKGTLAYQVAQLKDSWRDVKMPFEGSM